MKRLLKVGAVSFGLGLFLFGADAANAQTRRGERREYRQEVRDARRDYRDDVRDGHNRGKARQEFREERREARQDYRQDVRRGSSGWYWYNGGRRLYYPYSSYVYRNGRFYRRY